MEILFLVLDPQDPIEPYFQDLQKACLPEHSVTLADTAKPLLEQMQGKRVVVDLGGAASHDVLDTAANAGVELWQVLGYGLNHIDIEHGTTAGLVMSHTPGPYTAVPLAEHALHLMFALAKRMHVSQQHLEEGRFYQPFVDELAGRSLLLIGFGASARKLAARAVACDMRVSAVDPIELPPETRNQYDLDFLGHPLALSEILPESDYVSIHVPLTDETFHLIDRDMLALFRPTARIVNVSRGAIIDESALTEALIEGRLGGAGLDVFEDEPVPADNPLRTLDNVVLTPHIAGATTEASKRKAAAVADNARRLEREQELLFVVTRNAYRPAR